MRMLEGFAAQAAVALQLAQARREAERVVLYEDRDRIARDLHDLVIQRLFASGMQLESSTRLLENAEAVARVRAVVDDLDVTIREIRSAIYALQTPATQSPRVCGPGCWRSPTGPPRPLGFAPSLRFDGAVDTRVPDPVGDHLGAVLARGALQRGPARAATRVRGHAPVAGERGDPGGGWTTGSGCPGRPAQRAGQPGRPRGRGSAGRSRAQRGPRAAPGLVWSAPHRADGRDLRPCAGTADLGPCSSAQREST